MFSLFFATTVLGRVESFDRSMRAHFAASELQGSPCNCNWISIPGACQTPDGTFCWSYCCKGPSPTPSPGPTPPPSPIGDWEPVNLDKEYGNCGGSASEELLRSGKNLTRALADGFSCQGNMRYHSAQKYNLLGGGIKFTADLSQVQDMVNANLYLVIPGTLDSGSHFYCDNSATFVGKGNACIELDIIESNGHKLVASTMHTRIGTGAGCDTWGCRGLYYFGNPIDGNRAFDVDVEVSNDGNITVQLCQDGRCQYVFNNVGGFDGAAKAAIVDGMRNHGAVVVSSMWTGWVPPNSSGTGNLGGSHYTVSNVKYKGRVMGNTN